MEWTQTDKQLPELGKEVLFIFADKSELWLGRLADHGRHGLYFESKPVHHKGTEIRKLFPTELVSFWQCVPDFPVGQKELDEKIAQGLTKAS